MTEDKIKEHQGTVVWFDGRRGCGFIADGEEDRDYFIHWSNIQMEGFKTLLPNQRVAFVVGENHKGPQAEGVRILDQGDEQESQDRE